MHVEPKTFFVADSEKFTIGKSVTNFTQFFRTINVN